MFRRMDFLLAGITVVLTLFGLAMIASVSVFESYQITYRLTGGEAPTNSFYLWRSFIHVIISFGVLGFATIIPYRTWERFALPLFGFNILLLIAVFIPGIGADVGTAYSWIDIGLPFTIQPSEFLKLTLTFYLAVWLQKRETLIGTWKEGFIPFASILVIATFLVAIQPDLGSFLVLSAISITKFFIAGGNLSHIFLGGGIAGVLGLPVILNQDYVVNRFKAFLSDDPSLREGIGHQIYQALIAVGSGGAFGVGYGKSIQKFGYLPEVYADMIFAAMGEELGFFRLLIILAMYVTFVWRGYRIAQEAPDRFGFLVATGVTTWVAFQTMLNIAVNLSLFPLTGLTLPFISYGGSSLMSLMAGVGILLNISMHSTEVAAQERRPRSRGKSTPWWKALGLG